MQKLMLNYKFEFQIISAKSSAKLGMMASVGVIAATQEAEAGGFQFQASLGNLVR